MFFIDKMKKLGIVACDCSESLYDGDDGYDMTEEFNNKFDNIQDVLLKQQETINNITQIIIDTNPYKY